MTKPLQVKQPNRSGGPTALRHRWLSLLFVVVLVLFSVASANVYGQDSIPDKEAFVRDNGRVKTVGAAASSYSGEALRRIHPTNLLRALQVIDPSICGVDAQAVDGADPNAAPRSMNLQGIQSFAWKLTTIDALPLIIVDGHSESIGRLQDFDIQRVERVTLLKDATATVLYGVRAGQGAIVITTKTPEEQHLRLTYTFDGMFQKASLGGFDPMSAAQKLSVEKQAGLYDGNEALYDQRMKNGTTDWLKMPVQTAFSHKHRVAVDGGDDNLRYRGVLYVNPQQGVMKGSDRMRYGASAFIGYTTSKLQISNELSIDMINASESMYGSMSEWARMNSYYTPYDERGEARSILGEGTFSEQVSPLYETTLKSSSDNKITRVNNNLTVRWSINDHFSIAGQFNMTRDLDKRSEYISPQSLRFAEVDSDKKGHYRIFRDQFAAYQEKLWADYQLKGSRNTLRASLGVEAYASTITQSGYTGVGMSSDHMNYVSFAQRYAPGRAEGTRSREHVLSGYGVVSWGLDEALFVDLAGRLDKSSMLAPENRTAGSYALTAAYDLRKVLFESSKTVRDLRVTAGYGSTAGYVFDYHFANPLYGYDIDNPYLDGIGDRTYNEGLVALYNQNAYNSSLKWKATRNVNLGIQTQISTVSLAVKYYNARSKNLLTMEQPQVVFGSMVRYTSAGTIRNSGFEYQISAGVLERKAGFNLTLFTNGVVNRSKITDLPDYSSTLFGNYLFTTRMSGGMVRGDAADAIYAVPSAGIDALTGREQFYLRDGSVSGTPTADDVVCMGSATPKLRGTFGALGSWRNLDFALYFSYSLGGKFYDLYTQQMVDLAGYEANLPVSGADKWSSTNTSGRYQGVGAPSDFSSSRFVTTRNTLSLSSLRIGYAFPQRIASKLAMQGLKVSFTCDDLFYTSSVKSPRGFIYPYAASFILSLQATF